MNSSLKSLIQMLKKKKVIYIQEFPYSRKSTWTDGMPQWRQDPQYRSYRKDDWDEFEDGWFALVVQSKTDGTVYNLLVCNIRDDGREPTDAEWKSFQNMSVRKFAQWDEDGKMDYRILGMDTVFTRKEWVYNPEKFWTLGDQFVKFFDEENIYYYQSSPVYPTDYAEETVDELEEDYFEKNKEYWASWNLTDENLGIASFYGGL